MRFPLPGTAGLYEVLFPDDKHSIEDISAAKDQLLGGGYTPVTDLDIQHNAAGKAGLVGCQKDIGKVAKILDEGQ